jgi:O-antigen ligase
MVIQAYQIFLEHPVWGTGPGTFHYYSAGGFFYAHATPLELLATRGVVGTAVFYALFLWLLLRFWDLKSGLSVPEDHRAMANAGLSAGLVLILLGMGRVIIGDKQALLILTLLGLVCVFVKMNRAQSSSMGVLRGAAVLRR